VEVTDESAEKVEKTNLILKIHSENLNWKKFEWNCNMKKYNICGQFDQLSLV